MALKRPQGPAGTLVVLEHTSEILKGNPLGEPHVRKLGVQRPLPERGPMSRGLVTTIW